MTSPKESSGKGSTLAELYDNHPNLIHSYTRVSNAILDNAHRMRKWKEKGTVGLSPNELLFFIFAIRFKRQSNSTPWVSTAYMSRTMGINKSSVRRITRRLHDDGLLKKMYDPAKDKFPLYDISPMFKRVDAIVEWDRAQKAQSTEGAA